jgi:pseudouridine-5'-monophosphatase
MADHRRVRAAIFDLDGLLLDTEPLYLDATTEVLARHGVALEMPVLRRQIGIPSVEGMQWLAEYYGLAISGRQIHEEREALLETLLPGAPPRPGAVELTTALADGGVPIAVGTSSTNDTLARKIQNHGDWIARFDHVVTHDHVERGKPHPDIFLEAAARLGVAPDGCVVFEDARSGVEAAHAAGMAVVMVPTEGVDTTGLEPNELLNSLAEFDAVGWGLL